MKGLLNITVILLVTLCSTINGDGDRRVIYPSDLKPSEANSINEFAWKLFSESRPKPLTNFILCPLAVQYQLLLLELGADGETKEQLRYVAGGASFSSSSKSFQENKIASRAAVGTEIFSANGIFINNRLKLNRTYKEEIEKERGEIYNVDFGSQPAKAKNSINLWVSLKTDGNIQQFLPNDLDVSAVNMFLISALYFRGQWQYKLNNTRRGQFFANTDKVVMADYMEIVHNLNFERIRFDDGMGMELVELPYTGGDYSMILLVPNKNTPVDIAIKLIEPKSFDVIMKKNNERNSISIRLVMPKFNITSRFSMVNALLKMGLTNVFTKMSNLPYLTDNSEALMVSDILQQASLNVDESGTVASAATGTFIVPLSADNKHEIIIDRPFISIIFDRKNQCPLFLSKIENPM